MRLNYSRGLRSFTLLTFLSKIVKHVLENQLIRYLDNVGSETIEALRWSDILAVKNEPLLFVIFKNDLFSEIGNWYTTPYADDEQLPFKDHPRGIKEKRTHALIMPNILFGLKVYSVAKQDNKEKSIVHRTGRYASYIAAFVLFSICHSLSLIFLATLRLLLMFYMVYRRQCPLPLSSYF